MSQTTTASTSPALRWALVITIAILAFFATYRYAIASGSVAPTDYASATGSAPVAVALAGVDPSAQDAGAAASSGCSCCGGATAPADAVKSKAAEVTGDVQKIAVDVSNGYYEPATIELKAGIPAEITFSQSSGCTAVVESADLGFSEDLTGGPKTVKLDALQAGTYAFNCGMQMVFGSIVVK